jgi:Outer membrane protein beta-barrel domain
MKKTILAIAFVSVTIASVNAQSFFSFRRERSVILTVGTGTSTYLGELANKSAIINAQPNINVGLQYYFTDRISVRTELNYFRLSGNDDKSNDINRLRRNLSFFSNNLEYNVVGQINLFQNGDRYYRRPLWNVYGFGGIGLLYFNPKTTYQGKTYALEPLHTEGVAYSRVGLVIPYGLGIRFKLTPQVNLAIEGGWRKTFTDYLDDVSTVYKDPATFTDPIAKALADRSAPDDTHNSIRGNPKNKDSYMLLNVKFEWYLPWDVGGSGRSKYHPKRRSIYNSRGGLRRR